MGLTPVGGAGSQTAPAVSVIVNCRNGEKYLREALDSVFAQTYDDWEIVFWDNLSTDRSAEVAKTYGDRVRYFRGGPLGLHAARRCAVEQARGRYVGFLDTDDLWLPRKLELQVPRFERDGDIALVYSNGELFDDSGGRRLQYWRSQREGHIFRRMLSNYDLLLPTVMIRRSAYDAVGGFDEEMKVAGDADLFLRVCQRSKVGYVHAITARYREHGASVTNTRPEYFLADADAILRGLRGRDPGFDFTYGPEITAFWLQRRKAFMIGTWRKGDARSVRRHLWSYCREIPVLLALFVASYFPSGLLWKLRRRNPLGRLRGKYGG